MYYILYILLISILLFANVDETHGLEYENIRNMKSECLQILSKENFSRMLPYQFHITEEPIIEKIELLSRALSPFYYSLRPAIRV